MRFFLLSCYSSWIVSKLLDPAKQALWRRRIWTLFSLVFFGQLFLGLAYDEIFLMTGRLHLPVPAMIVAAPVYRAQISFMVPLFLTTVLLVGPAWCSYLCYIGAWDNLGASVKRGAEPLPFWTKLLRPAFLTVVMAAALILRLTGATAQVATFCGAAFGVLGLVVMASFSTRKGAMVHCLSWCPVGFLAAFLGKLNPFRLRISSSCIECGLCSKVCRYDALRPQDLRRGRPSLNCTLCGDCIGSCPKVCISYQLPYVSSKKARRVFLSLVVSLHAVFLGVARI